MSESDPWTKQKTTIADSSNQVSQHLSASLSLMDCFLITLLATLAMLVAGYLTGVSLLFNSAPAGCGSGSGCAQVLASKWAKLWTLPVSGLATMTYLLISVTIWFTNSRSRRLQQYAWLILLILAGAVASSATWFVYLQFAVIGETCPYCLFDHAIGLIIAIYIIIRMPIRQPIPVPENEPSLTLSISKAISLLIVGVGLTCTLAIAQSTSRQPLHQIQNTSTQGDFIRGQNLNRQVGVLDGQLQLTITDEPLIGQVNAPKIIVVMFDYACVHCRHTHQVLTKYQDQYPRELAIIALPVPLNHKCNPYIADDSDRFQHSCELAEIALAVWLTDRSRFAEFNTWLFEFDQLKSPAQAKHKARQLVDKEHFSRSLKDPKIKKTIQRNVEAFAASKANQVPVLIMPYTPAITGKLEDISMLEQLFQQKK